MDTMMETTIISRPTQNCLIDYQGDALLFVFPLQFLYDASTNQADSKQAAISKLAYLQHLQHLSI
jgi:hypothetical protein